MSEWKLKMRYSDVFGVLELAPSCPHEEQEPDWCWRLPINDLLGQLKVRPEHLRALLADSARPVFNDVPTDDICTMALPERLDGKTVLDIGGYDGRFAAECLRRGAKEAICLDNTQWEHYGWKQPEPLAGVQYFRGDFMEWQEPFDVVLFFNVLYHCPEPRTALAHLREITREQMLLCSLVVWDDREVWYPRAPFEVNPSDDTVFWSPSDAGLAKLLSITGWETEDVAKAAERLVLRCRPKEDALAA